MESPKNKSRVRINGKLTVVSSTPVGPGRSSPLTSLDHAMGTHVVRIVYYYKQADEPEGPVLEFDRIRESLCELLCLYPTLTGRLARDEDDGNWRVRFNDAGVRVVRATVETTVDEWIRSADGDDEKDLTVWDDMPHHPHMWPPFRIQLNAFKCGGVAIGLSFTHLLCDPTTATFFFNSWSESHRRQPLSHPPFIHPDALRHRPPAPSTATKQGRTQVSPPAPSNPAYATASKSLSTATFSFSDESIRHKLLSDATPFDLVAALFWTRINALEPGDNYNQCHWLNICIDFRKRLHAPLPYGYFGNAVHFTRLKPEAEDLIHVAENIRRHVSSVREDDVWSTVDSLESRRDEPLMMYGPELTCVNMEHLIGERGPVMYTSEFGGECRPVHVSYDVEGFGEGLIWVMPSPEGGMARRVKVVLKAELVAKLCEDELITSLGPTLMISGPPN